LRGLAGLVLGGALLAALFVPAGTPALEASYLLSADRSLQGKSPYNDLAIPLDVIFLSLYRLLGADAAYLLRLWKAIGGIALVLFMEASRSRLFFTKAALLRGSIAWALYLFRPWTVGIEVGEPALWLLLLLHRSPKGAFLRGALTGGVIGLYPVAALSTVWVVYRRLEEHAHRPLTLWSLGMLWSGLGFAAALKLIGWLSAYIHTYWLIAWQDVATLSLWEWIGRISLLLLLWMMGQEYFRQPYAERRRFRDRLWAGIASFLLPGAGGLWLALLVETRGSTLLRYMGAVGFIVQGALWGKAGIERPDCTLPLASESCLWGTPPCYVQLQGPYACDWTVPYRWERLVRPPNWEMFYDRWGTPKHIIDYANFWVEARYFLPHLSVKYAPVDSSMAGGRLYQRR